ncbi:putative Gnk2-like domain-containing protein [Helianthus annuus]|nr:putative Gnk2-like domain-containing protein [Helianthus annuus]
METKFLVSLMFLQAIINGVNLLRPPDQHGSKCSKNGDLNSNVLLKSRDVALDELYKSFRLPFTGAQRSNNGGIWAHALCPPKEKMEECRECVKDTIDFLKKDCPKQKEGATWSIFPHLYCMVRYADHPNQGNLAEWAWVQFNAPPPAGPGNATAGELEKAWNNLANTIMEKATGVKNLERYWYGSVLYGPHPQNLYGTMHCAPNISDVICKKCLSDGIKQLNECCCKSRKQSGRTFSVNCAVWYSHARITPDTLPTISAP